MGRLGERGLTHQAVPNLVPAGKPAISVDAIAVAINAARTRAGLPTLQPNAKVAAAAQRQADYMASIERAVHTGAKGETVGMRLAAEDFKWTQAGEFIASGFEDPDELVAAWLSSPGHREILLGSFTSFGVGIRRDSSGVTYISGVAANGW